MKIPLKAQTLPFTAFFLFTFLLGIYFLSYYGIPVSDDEQQFASTAQNIALRGEFSTPQMYGNNRILGKFSSSGLLHPILGAPIIHLIRSTSLGGVQALYLLSPFYTALTGVILLLICVSSGFNLKTGVSTGLVFGLCTIAWPYSQTFFREPLAMLLLTGAWFSLLLVTNKNYPVPHRVIAWIAFAVTYVGALNTKILLLTTLPAFIYASWTYSRGIEFKGNKKLRFAALFLLIILVLGFIFTFNELLPEDASSRLTSKFFARLWRYRLNLPYHEIPEAITGMLFSPSKGLLVYSPILILLPLGLKRSNKADKQRIIFAGLALAGMILAQAVAYGTGWWNTTWGTRFLVPVLPILIAGIAPFIEKVQNSPKTWLKPAFWVFAGFGIMIQVGGVLIATPVYVKDLYLRKYIPDIGLTIWSPQHAPIIKHWQLLLSGEPISPAVFRLYSYAPPWALSILLLCLGVVIGSALLTKSILQSQNVRKAYTRWAILFSVGMLIILPPLMLYTYQIDPQYNTVQKEISAAHTLVSSEAKEGDVILVYAYLKPAWYYFLNNYKDETVWYSLPRTFPTGDTTTTISLINKLAGEYSRIWVVSETTGAEPLIPFAEEYIQKFHPSVFETTFSSPEQPRRIRVSLYQIDTP